MDAWVIDADTQFTTASILVNNLNAVLSKRKVSSQEIETAMKPFAVIQWNKDIISRIGSDKINRVLGRLKRSPVCKVALRLVIDHFHTARTETGVALPNKLTEWITLIAKYSLNTLADYATWVPSLQFLEDNKITNPVSLSNISLVSFNEIADGSPFADLLTSLYQAVRLEFASAKGVTPLSLRFRENNFSLVHALRAKNVEESTFGIELANHKEALGLPENYENLGPAARITALQNATPDSQRLLRFLSAGAQSNILQQVRSTLPSVASGVRCYLSFCTLLGVAPFPPTMEGVARWSTVFSPGKTFALYVNHLVKACHLMGIDNSWKTDIITALAKGLRNKVNPRVRFHNSLAPKILDKIIRHETWSSELARLCYVTFLFLLRLPSEALPLTRALPNELLLSPDIPSSKAVIGLREFQGEKRLVLKLSHRKNTRSVYTAMRPCFCGDNALLPRHNCPIHRFWAAVIENTEPGSQLFPSLQRANFSRVFRAVLAKLGVQDADRYSSHCLRRGAANAILQSGSTLSEIMRTGGWKSSSFKVYLDLHRSEELSLQSILREDTRSSSESSFASETSSGTASPKAASDQLNELSSDD